MYLSISSVFSAVVLAFAVSNVAATPLAENDSSLETRSNWHHNKNHRVTVGAYGKLRYDPQYVHAKVGDFIEFEFHPKNHTVTESSFDNPCNRLVDSSGGQIGFRTGFVPVPATQTSHFPTRKFKVTDDKPHWFYCGQTGHCPAGMVFAVNPPKHGNTFYKFQDKAVASGK
ncbi:plastocyanin-like domain protein [Ceratobasidium sp. AG-Ba]|nr:plastocyanin-like domain protein [Ceratobasidium sp. AG-Ba]QRW05093.1 plastocyanin-like domain protein [Ceratobasidium sp. AG-Ba]